LKITNLLTTVQRRAPYIRKDTKTTTLCLKDP